MVSRGLANRRRRRAAAFTLVLAVGCTPHPVGPARTSGKYEGKAVTTAESALSRVETVRLAAEVAGDDGAFGPYLSVLISDQEDALSGLQGTFASIQPPNERSDDVRAELVELLNVAIDDVAAARIAIRRGQFDELAAMAEPLADDATTLSRFIEEHGS
jgi:hypothetical protein